MPTSAPRRCRTCRQLVRGQCPTCTPPAWSRQPDSWRQRGGSTRAWRSVRQQRLDLEPLCRTCEAVATVVDHLDGTDYDDDSGTGRSWLNVAMTRSLCPPCHGTRTARQGHAAQRPDGSSR